MRLAALTAGLGAEPKDFTGTVHSVFVRACNLELASGRLLGLVERDIGAVPRGFQLATRDGFSFLDHVETGAGIGSRGGLLRIERSGLSVDLRPAVPWRSNLDKYPIACDRKEVAMAWRAAWTALAVDGGAVSLQRQAGNAIKNLVNAVRTSQPDPIVDIVARLIGLGDGLTPAGDDFLVGFVAGLAALPPDRGRAAFRAAITTAILAAMPQTGAISRLYLEAAIAGEVSEPLAALATAIGRGDAAEAARAAAIALAVGVSSGAAASYGLLLAVRASEAPTRPVVEPPPASAPRHGAIRPPGK